MSSPISHGANALKLKMRLLLKANQISHFKVMNKSTNYTHQEARENIVENQSTMIMKNHFQKKL